MKNLFTLLFFILLGTWISAQKYITKIGSIHFEASVPLFEDVDAKNSTAVTVLNSETGDIATIAMTKNFKFKMALMEEHFNENYAETSKYPKATFTGKILNYNKSNISETPKDFTISGTLNFHGVDNKISSPAKIYMKDGKIFISGKFSVKAADYKVTIPKMVMKKVAETVNVDYQYVLTKQ